MNKRIVSMGLAGCLTCAVLLTSGCARTEQTDAYSLVHQAVEKTDSLDSVACMLDVMVDVDRDGTKMSIPLKADIKATGLEKGTSKAYSAITLNVADKPMEFEAYHDGDWAYVRMDDKKVKANVDEADSKFDYVDDIDSMLQDLPKTLLDNAEVTEHPDGSETVTVSVPDGQFSDIFDDFLASVSNLSGAGNGGVTVSDATVKITVKDGYVTKYDTDFKAKMTVDGTATAADVKACLTYTAPGKTVDVTPMEGHTDYEEFDLNKLFDR